VLAAAKQNKEGGLFAQIAYYISLYVTAADVVILVLIMAWAFLARMQSCYYKKKGPLYG